MSETEITAPVPVAAEELASRLAARLCHDFVNPASAIISGLDLLEDPTAADMRDEAMNLIAASARKLVDQISFSRVAFGAAPATSAFDSQELERLTRLIYAHVRPGLEWDIPPQSLGGSAARLLLNLAQLAAGALPVGGTASARVVTADGHITIGVEARGGKARLQAEVQSGLAGEPLGDGLGGRWVQAYYVHALALAAGGEASATADEGVVSFTATIPA